MGLKQRTRLSNASGKSNGPPRASVVDVGLAVLEWVTEAWDEPESA